MKRILLVVINSFIILLLSACGNENVNIFNDVQAYVIDNEILPSDAKLVHKYESWSNSEYLRESLYESDSNTWVLKIETLDKNKVHCTLYENVSYTVKESKESKVKDYKIKYENANIVWNKVARYGDLIIEEWVEEVDNADSGD